METIGMQSLRPNLSQTVKSVAAGSPISVTNNNLPVAVIMSAALYDSIWDALGAVGLQVEGGKVIARRPPPQKGIPGVTAP